MINERMTGAALTYLGCLYAVVDYLAVSGVKTPETRREWLTLAAGCIVAVIGYLSRGRKDLASKAQPEPSNTDKDK